MLLNGCQKGKGTPKLVEVKCPQCGEAVVVFVKMGSAIGETGTLIADEICPAAIYSRQEATCPNTQKHNLQNCNKACTIRCRL